MTDLTLGAHATDSISGWSGVLTGRFEFLNGCVRWEIAGADKDGKPESFVFDAQQITLSGRAVTKPWEFSDGPPTPTGGPRTNRPPDR